jgi:hypothetical protein
VEPDCRGAEDRRSRGPVNQRRSGAEGKMSSEAVEQREAVELSGVCFCFFCLELRYSMECYINALKCSTHIYVALFFPVPLYRPRGCALALIY